MGCDVQKIVVEASELAKLFEGSLESKLQAIADAVIENESFFGGKPHLFSTHEDHVVVFVEGLERFVICKYSTVNGISFSNLKEAKIDVLSEDTLLSFGVDSVANGGNIRHVLSALVKMPKESTATRINDSVAEQSCTLHLGSQFTTKMSGKLKTV